jgi:hypothetical protein
VWRETEVYFPSREKIGAWIWLQDERGLHLVLLRTEKRCGAEFWSSGPIHSRMVALNTEKVMGTVNHLLRTPVNTTFRKLFHRDPCTVRGP